MASEDTRIQAMDKVLKGTTTLGIVCRDGVVLATDKRATAGSFIAHRATRKIIKIEETIATTIAGSVADAQMIMDLLSAELRLYRGSVGRAISVKGVATLASNILFSSRSLMIQAIVAGLDENGPSMFMLDPFGTLTEEKQYIATGSGTPYVAGVLESGYRENMSVKEAVPLVVKAITSAMRWDPGSGEGFDVVSVTKQGVRDIPKDEISKIVAAS